jgi:hypothetical protein
MHDMAYMTEPYRNANKVANILMAAMNQPTDDLKGLASIAREWRETEQMKREWRGLPRLSPASVRELMAAKRDAARTLDVSTTSDAAFTEAEPSKESLNPSETVTAEPPQTPP